MLIELFARGLIIGLVVAAPVGPIGMLVICRTLAHGRMLGLLTGLGAAAADALYGCVGAFGLTFVSGFLLGHALGTKLLGGLFLCYLGIGTFRSNPREDGGSVSHAHHAAAFLSTLLLTLANPITILSFTAIFASLGLGTGGYGAAATVVTSVFLGSALWWVILSGGVSLVKHRLKPGAMGWINRISGAFLFSFGALALSGLAR
ncbi:MAG TPA: LysE family transporter [Gammaproteobacteria bacterium]|nr:LysE family transporter [Gammaproteobacteria bacterium]